MNETKVAIVSTVKCPETQLEIFVGYHLGHGLDYIFLFFDDPNDPAFIKMNKIDKVKCIRCDDRHWKKNIGERFRKIDLSVLTNRQRVNANYSLSMSRTLGIDWLIHIDSDEIIYPIGRLKSFLSRGIFPVYRFTIMECIPEKMEPSCLFNGIKGFKYPATFHYPTLLRYPLKSILLYLARLTGCQFIFSVNKDFFRGHLKSKSCCHTGADIKEVRIHQPELERKYFSWRWRRIYLLHFDSNGYENWKEKWLIKRDNNVLKMASKNNPKRRRYKYVLANLFNKENKSVNYREIYKQTHYIPPTEWRILRTLGLVSKSDRFRAFFQYYEEYKHEISLSNNGEL